MNFKPGDVVQLKSGGPAMTVSEVSPNVGIVCHWFNCTANEWSMQRGVFTAPELKPAD